MPEILYYTATAEQVEALRFDIGEKVSPYQQIAEKYARDINKTLLARYGDVIHESKKEEMQGVDNRVIIASRKSFERAFLYWPTIYERTEVPIAFTSPEGNHIWFLDPKDVKKNPPKTIKLRGRKIEKNGKMTPDTIAELTLQMGLTEEICHMYQDWNLSHLLYELGGKYYARIVAQELGYPYPQTPTDDMRFGLYNRAVKRFGNEMHQVFFGSLPDSGRKDEILAAIDEELYPRMSELFKDGYLR